MSERHGRNEVDGTARAAVDGDDLPGASASVGDGGGGNDGRRGRTADADGQGAPWPQYYEKTIRTNLPSNFNRYFG